MRLMLAISSLQTRPAWLAIRIAAAVTFVVLPFGYAVTGVQTDIFIGVGCGLAIGVGVGLRGGSLGGPWTGILVGSIVGVAAALIAGALPFNGWGFVIGSILALAVGLIDGFGGSSFVGYRDVIRETFIVCVLLALGLFPSALALGSPSFSLTPVILAPLVALVAGMLSHRREGWHDARPPRLLILAAIVIVVLMNTVLGDEIRVSGVSGTLANIVVAVVILLMTLALVALTATAFLAGRTAITWLQPRLRVYGYLADYLRVMWVPIGGFAVGYLTIIVLFSGFYGMLEHFRPGAFAGGAAGIADWLSFAFFTALGQDFTVVAPISVSARVLVGAHLILSAGWALVLFAAVMSSIGPKLDRIARRHAEKGGE